MRWKGIISGTCDPYPPGYPFTHARNPVVKVRFALHLDNACRASIIRGWSLFQKQKQNVGERDSITPTWNPESNSER